MFDRGGGVAVGIEDNPQSLHGFHARNGKLLDKAVRSILRQAVLPWHEEKGSE